ncbi:MAG: TraB/GumN family protein [Rhodanobacteraceae bacterium]
MTQGQECLISTLDAIAHDFPRATALANAWATGDLRALRKLLSSDQRDPCFSGLAEMASVRDMPQQVQRAWIDAAQKALARNDQSFALLPMSELVSAFGYLDVLTKDGYAVQAPSSLTGAAAGR